MRFYWDEAAESCAVKCLSFVHHYGFEYVGLPPLLVSHSELELVVCTFRRFSPHFTS